MSRVESNAEQIDYWNDRGAASWVPLQDRLDAMLKPFGDLALERAGLSAGHRVLDVGCGCGATSLEAAEQIGDGTVVGIDVSAPMLARARERAGDDKRLRFVEADAQSTDLASLGVDRIVSRFGVMFFANPVAAFSNLATAAVPGGRLSFVCWQSPRLNPWFSFAGRSVAHLLDFPPSDPDAPGPFSFADHEHIARVVLGGGFSDLSIEAHEQPISLGGGGDIDELVQFAIDLGPIGRGITEDPSKEEPVRSALAEAIGAVWHDGVVSLDSAVWVVTATR